MEIIQKATNSAGGKSGDLFFQTYDNKLIIKTVNKTDLEEFKKRIQPYYEHIIRYPQTFIAKIFGIYTFKFSEVEEK